MEICPETPFSVTNTKRWTNST